MPDRSRPRRPVQGAGAATRQRPARDALARARHRLARGWLRLRWELRDRPQLGTVRWRRIHGLDLVILPGVLDPGTFESGVLLAEAVDRHPARNGRLLDLGCGSGLVGLSAARGGARVVASDVDPEAVRCTRLNAMLGGLEASLDVRQGDLFAPLAGERFDLVCFNPPWLPAGSGIRHGLELALDLPEGLPTRFTAELEDHLGPGGEALVVLSSTGLGDRWTEAFDAAAWRRRALLTLDRAGERLTCWGIERRG